MTCQELRLYFEDPLRHDAELRSELEHLAHCGDCARYVEAQRKLGNSLRLLRESVPQYPTSLDAAVPAAYRRVMAEKTARAVPVPRERSFGWLRWSVVGAAILLGVVLLYRNQPHVGPATARPAPVQPAPVAPSPVAVETTVKRPQAKKPLTAKRSQPAPVLNAATPATLPPGFRSLMYCDELSCGDAMEVIRVQLPSSAMRFAPAAGAGGPVFADVLVGPDGIARGIRVVE